MFIHVKICSAMYVCVYICGILFCFCIEGTVYVFVIIIFMSAVLSLSSLMPVRARKLVTK